MLAWFHALDLQLLYLINVAWSRPWLDPLMARVSDFNSWRYPLALAVVLALIFGGFRGRQLVIVMAACLVIGDGMIDWGFKLAVHRPRPSETEPHLRVVSVQEIHESQPRPTTRGRSFTSGHACNNRARFSGAGPGFSGRGPRWSATRAFTPETTIRAIFSARGSSPSSIRISS
jgi:membrane-associated phospholipid phosphatase